MSPRSARFGVPLAVLGGVFLALCARGHVFASRADEAVFVLLARALRSGRFPAADHLPGFPALIALPSAALEGRWDRYWLLMLPFSLAYAAAAYALAKRILGSRPAAAAAAALCALSPAALELSGAVLSDVPFAALAAAVLAGVPAAPLPLVCAGAAAGALMRPQGVLLAAAAAAGLWACRGRKPAAALLACAGLPLALWLLRNFAVAGTPSDYAGQWASEAARADAFALLEAALGRGAFGLPGAAGSAAGLLLLGSAFAGARLLLRRPAGAAAFAPALFAASALIVHATWGAAAPRYVLPILPMLWALSVATLLALAPARALAPAGAALLAAFLAQAAPSARAGLAGGGWAHQEAMDWLAREPSARKVESLACGVAGLLSGKESTCPPAVEERDAWLGWLAVRGVTHVHDFDFARDGYLPEPVARFARRRGSWLADEAFFTPAFADRAEGAVVYAFKPAVSERIGRAWREYERAVALAAGGYGPRREVEAAMRLAAKTAPELALPWAALADLEDRPARKRALFAKAAANDPSSERARSRP